MQTALRQNVIPGRYRVEIVRSSARRSEQPARRRVARIATASLGTISIIVLGVFAFLYWQGSRAPATNGQYVALGSSFAAGIGLGPRVSGSPLHCLRTAAGYPSLIAHRTGLRLVDMTCSGSTSAHILDGGQLMLGPQLAAVGPQTRLVTVTTGGNDVHYIGDLMAASGSMGGLVSWLGGPISPAADRPYERVAANLRQIVQQVRIKAPKARIVLVSYPTIMPVQGNCAATGVSDAQARISRDVASRLAAATRRVAHDEGTLLVDMALLSTGHDVCSHNQWVNGADPKHGTAFHPNAAGSAATASAIIKALGR